MSIHSLQYGSMDLVSRYRIDVYHILFCATHARLNQDMTIPKYFMRDIYLSVDVIIIRLGEGIGTWMAFHLGCNSDGYHYSLIPFCHLTAI